MTPGDEMMWCRLSKKTYPSSYVFCPEHPGEELVPVPAGATENAATTGDDDPARARTTCWNCGTPNKDLTNTTCADCHESLVPPALVIDFPGGLVIVLTRGASVELGRAGKFRHVFRRHRNVSRLHATVSVDEEGEAWITPSPAAPNGTFVNGCEIFDRTKIRPETEIRFATDQGTDPGPVSTQIRLPQRDVAHRANDQGTGTRAA
jgi:FHA domain